MSGPDSLELLRVVADGVAQPGEQAFDPARGTGVVRRELFFAGDDEPALRPLRLEGRRGQRFDVRDDLVGLRDQAGVLLELDDRQPGDDADPDEEREGHREAAANLAFGGGSPCVVG